MRNTCRSPIAEAVFRKYVKENNLEQFWEVDSAALFGYHEGKNINTKSREVLERNGIVDYNHVARIINKEDFHNFDWILGMDYYNLNLLSGMQPQGSSVKIDLLGHYDPEGEVEIEDPYCDQQTHKFETIYSQCIRCVQSFIEKHK
ncbi:low molecular weight phosphotyrosine protein phosphatase-like isoform X2 [Phymastichus coffea]|uniref:low molecular weight phosphotyrosine protein phosphatase-like isoform X2 n=1 Tax=Phymastichus coffea TaxID=108790 RepID=UPI00273CB89A|nr:low molecular weight phosphotyrosine protein phosphatase-like isoform X2 [Phymastichus coffea]